MVAVMRKSVAVGIAAATALVVAAWRQIQRDNSIDTDSADDGPAASEPEAPTPAATPGKQPDSAPANALFTPSVSENSTKAELYELATELKIEGRSKMNKAELLKAIRSSS